MSRKQMVPPVTLKGAPVSVERFADFSPHRPASAPGYGDASNTPAAEEARAVLSRRSRFRLRTG